MRIIEEHIKTEVVDAYDVIVCGGGFGGISAALAAAREGKKTLLLERLFMLGGLGTAGIVTIYLPLCDGLGRQVSFGIAEELLKLSIIDGAEDRYPANWLDGVGTRTEQDPRYEVQYNAQLFAIHAERLLRENGVDILYGTTVVAADVQEGKICHLVTENKTGRQAYAVSAVVDATGDCDMAKLSGAPTANFAQGNVLAAWYYAAGQSGYHLHMVGWADIPDDEKTEENRVSLLMNRRFAGLDAKEVSDFMQLSHQSTYNHFLGERRKDATMLPVTMATMPQLRMTRRIQGEYTLAKEEMHRYFEDSIGMIGDWTKRGPVYEVPFRTLYSACVKNLITAGRCTSVTDSMWNVMRVIPCCAVTGQAAGTAAAMTDDFSTLNVAMLQKRLQAAGVVLHEKEL